MEILKPNEVASPNLFDPSEIDAIDVAIPDFYVPFTNPRQPETTYHIPCRELDPGEALVFQIAVSEKYPELPTGKITDLSDAERQAYWENQKACDALDNDLYTDVAQVSFLQEGWTRERVAKLPKSTRRLAYQGATAAIQQVNPVVDTFSEADTSEMPEDANDMPRGSDHGTERGDNTRDEPISE